jgi:hypothetical protein
VTDFFSHAGTLIQQIENLGIDRINLDAQGK